jgi:hypothetical protein
MIAEVVEVLGDDLHDLIVFTFLPRRNLDPHPINFVFKRPEREAGQTQGLLIHIVKNQSLSEVVIPL